MEMAAIRWKLAQYLSAHSLTPYSLAKASGIQRMNTIYRISRAGDEPTRIDLPTLAAIISGLRKLTGEDVQITDVLEYLPHEVSNDTETQQAD